MSNYGDFKLVSRARFSLPPKLFLNGPWTHLATITRGFKEYVVLLKEDGSSKIYIEEITGTGQFLHISDESLWRDLVSFATSVGVTKEILNQEILFAR